MSKNNMKNMGINDFSTVNSKSLKERIKDEKNAYIVDDEQEEKQFQMANLDLLTEDVLKFLEYIEQDELKKLEKKNMNEYKKRIELEFNDFVTKFPKIYNIFMDRKNLDTNLKFFLQMIENLKKVRDGNNEEKEFKSFHELISKKYIDPLAKK